MLEKKQSGVLARCWRLVTCAIAAGLGAQRVVECIIQTADLGYEGVAKWLARVEVVTFRDGFERRASEYHIGQEMIIEVKL